MHDHVFVNLPVVPSAARDLVTRFRKLASKIPRCARDDTDAAVGITGLADPLDSAPARALASQTRLKTA